MKTFPTPGNRRLCSWLIWCLWSASGTMVHSQSYTFSTIAGMAGNSGNVDGTNSTARFYNPTGLAIDGIGNLYVADQLNHTIRRISPVGTNWVVTTLAGLARASGSNDGTNTDARFSRPSGVVADGAGNLFVADTYNNTVRKIAPVGTNWVVTTVAGLAGAQGYDDGTNSDARFHTPQAVAMDQNENLFVTDRLNFTVRAVVPADTNWVTLTLAGLASIYGGFVDGTNGDAEFNLPFGVAVNSAGSLYVADWGNNAIRQIEPVDTNWVTTTVTGFLGTAGTNDGLASQAMFNSPNGIAVDGSGNLYVTDQYNNTIRKIAPVGSNWMVSTVGGVGGLSGTNNGTGSSARFYRPWGIAVDSAGNLFIADAFNNTIRMGVLPAAPVPSLQISRSGEQVVLSWPLVSSNYFLEAASALDTVAPWTRATNGVAVSGNSYVLTNNAGSAAAFFRLRKQ